MSKLMTFILFDLKTEAVTGWVNTRIEELYKFKTPGEVFLVADTLWEGGK